MGLLTRWVERFRGEGRSSLENPQTPLSYPAEWLLDIYNGGRTDAGVRVSELTAFQVSTFLACVDLIAGSIAALPMHIYEHVRTPNGRMAHHIAYDHGLYDLIHAEPNVEMSTFTFLKTFLAHLLAWGNGYAELQRDGGNRVAAIWPRNPYKTRPYRLLHPVRLDPEPWRPFPVSLAAGTLVYKTTDGIDSMDESEAGASNASAGRLIPAEDMLHVPGLSFDGRIGQDTVWLARQTLGMAIATEKFGAKYFANYARPGGILEAPSLTAEQREQSKRSWMQAQGGENSHRVAVLPPGFKFTPISNKPDESQMIETERAIRNKICAIFHVQPRLVADDQVKGRASAEQDAQELVQYTLMTWISALRQEWKRKLFPSPGVGRGAHNRFYMDFDLADMLRPDAATREKFYSTGRQWGFLNANDVRAYEKLNPIEEPWAEKYWIPVNMTLTETPIDPTHQDGAGNGVAPNDSPAQGQKRALSETSDPLKPNEGLNGPPISPDVSLYARVFRDAVGRICAREKRDLKAIEAAFDPITTSLWELYASTAMIDAEAKRFWREYMQALTKRAAEWTAERADTIADFELLRAHEAVRLSAKRAMERAK